MQLRTLEPFRFLLSFTILIWHYQHFFLGQNVDPFRFQPHLQPLYYNLKIFYLQGDFAVMLFWAVSGVVFAHVYGERLRRREIGFVGYAVNRLARLYPLHLVTLFVVAGLNALFLAQSLSLYGHEKWFIYQQNDLFHFGLNLLFASQWGFQDGFSFNGPIWSVSVEILAYLAFFLAALCLRLSVPVSAGLFFGLIFLTQETGLPVNDDIARCFVFFFGGVFVYALNRAIRERCSPRWTRGVDGALALMVVFCTVMVFDRFYFKGALFEAIKNGFHQADTAIPGSNWLFWNLHQHWDYLIFAPVCVLFLLRLEAYVGDRVPRPGLYLGKLTYSMYLWHFPIQLGIVLTLDRLGVGRAMFHHPAALTAFIAIVMAVSHLSFKWIEDPARCWIRTRAGGTG